MGKEEETAVQPRWHALDLTEVFARIPAGPEGLTNEEAGLRLAKHGPNRLRAAKARSPFRRFLSQFNNVLVYVLVGAGVITAVLQHRIDSAVIFGVVVVNAIIGFIQEGKAERALEAIRNLLSQSANVLRDGRRTVLSAANIVPGDIVFIQSGDKVPADLRLIKTKSLQIQEAALTGESVPVEKRVAPVADNATLGDRSSMAYSGTVTTYGQGTGVVIGSGDRPCCGGRPYGLRQSEKGDHFHLADKRW